MTKGFKGFQKGHQIRSGVKLKKSTKEKMRISNLNSEYSTFKKGHVPYNKGLPKQLQPRYNAKIKNKQKIKTRNTMLKGKIKHHLDHNRKNNKTDNIHYFKSQKKHMGYHKFKRDLVKKYLIN